MKSIRDPRYIHMISRLRELRKEKDISQVVLSARLCKDQQYVSKTESLVRRIDVIELYDWLRALECDIEAFIEEVNRLKK